MTHVRYYHENEGGKAEAWYRAGIYVGAVGGMLVWIGDVHAFVDIKGSSHCKYLHCSISEVTYP